jgi:effector-binding domain-containing protein
MKKIFFLLSSIIVLLLLAAYFTPIKKEQELFVPNTFQNIVAALMKPASWRNWQPDVMMTSKKDTASFKTVFRNLKNTVSMELPGKKIQVTQVELLRYQIEETMKGETSSFGFSIIPYIGNNQKRSGHNSKIIYTENSNFLFRLIPFLQKKSLAATTLPSLVAYLGSIKRFYGFNIGIKPSAETIFLTTTSNFKSSQLFEKLPRLFAMLKLAAKENNTTWNNNISFSPLNKDSVQITAGINVSGVVQARNTAINFRQLQPDQLLATGYYEGPFNERQNIYIAMQQYLSDHELIQGGAAFERYTELPIADQQKIKMELCIPLRQN